MRIREVRQQVAVSVIIIVSLSPCAISVGWVIAPRPVSFDGSGMPQRVIAPS